MYPLLSLVVADLLAGAKRQHLSTGFPSTDLQRTARAGRDLGFAIAVIFPKGDWPAFCDFAGFRQWRHDLFPCYCCNTLHVDFKSWRHISEVTLQEQPWDDYTTAEWAEDVERSTIKVLVATAAQRSLIFVELAYSNQFIGRALHSDIPSLNLYRGDRLIQDCKLR